MLWIFPPSEPACARSAMRSVINRCARWKVSRIVSVLLDPPEMSLDELLGSMMEMRSVFLYVKWWAYEFWKSQSSILVDGRWNSDIPWARSQAG